MISTKGRYALRFLIDVAENQSDGFVPLKDVAARQEISEKYLEIVVKGLVKGGLLDALRGKGGGYRLNRPPEEYSVKAMIERMEGPLVPVACLEPAHVHRPGADYAKDAALLMNTHRDTSFVINKCARPAFQLSGRWLR